MWELIGLAGAVTWIWVLFNSILDRIAIGLSPLVEQRRIVSDTELTVSFCGTIVSLMFTLSGFGAVITPNPAPIGQMTAWQIIIVGSIILAEVFFSLMGLMWAIGLRRYFAYRPDKRHDDQQYTGPLRRSTDHIPAETKK